MCLRRKWRLGRPLCRSNCLFNNRKIPERLDRAQKKTAGSQAVPPSKKTVLEGSYAPLSRPLFIYVNTKSLKTKPAVKKFVQYYLEHAAVLSEEVGYVPLAENEYEASLGTLQSLP